MNTNDHTQALHGEKKKRPREVVFMDVNFCFPCGKGFFSLGSLWLPKP